MKKELLQTIIALCACISLALGAIWYFATDEELAAVEQIAMMNKQEMQQYKAAQRYKELQSIKWNFEKEFGRDCQKCPPSVMDEYKRILHELEMIRKELNIK